MHYTLYCEADLLMGSVFFNVKGSMELARSLPDKSIASISCINCDALNDFEREGISNGFSYLEFPTGEIYECGICKAKMRVTSPYLFGFVKN